MCVSLHYVACLSMTMCMPTRECDWRCPSVHLYLLLLVYVLLSERVSE